MGQTFLLEETKEKFDASLEVLLESGYKIITGSLYVKSIISSINEDFSGIAEQLVSPFLSVTLENEEGRHKLIHENSPNEFTDIVNDKLDEDFTVIVGSTYFTNEKSDGYIKKFKCMKTFYTCFLCNS